jgi:hypothetical protein
MTWVGGIVVSLGVGGDGDQYGKIAGSGDGYGSGDPDRFSTGDEE